MNESDILITDQVAIVTGGGAGIGQGIAAGMAAFGANIVVAELDPERGAVTAALVRDAGREALVVQTDVTDSEQIRSAVEAANRHFGRIDILVNNAGGVRPMPFVEQSERSWRRHIDINLVSMLAATSAVIPAMAERGHGSIINVASIEAFRAAPGFSVYAACKAAMVSFTRSAAVELADRGIRVNGLAPDIIATPGIRGPVPSPLPPRTPEAEAGIRRYIPLGAEGDVEDCAAAAVFLSSAMGRYMSGVTLSVDGGTWASSGWRKSPDDGGWELYPGAAMA
jgi:NAD(P)-dependent dehydrogenase (short-subunit alcohol dehydrogenase family)